ncbi:MAG TPA: helix-turn-helix domain-containing protein [Solirubrobacterales bacterium]|nr:helix-turn-helix domain-containing protein [Solirubrobacterales bacterium]
MSRQAERSDATRARLVRAARGLFAKRGYAAVGTEEIVRRAKVTRGALYHHFEDKRDLFRAVHEQIEAEVTNAIAADLAGAGADDPVEALTRAVRAFLDACTRPEIARITLLEAPSVLGWAEWRRIDEQYGLGLTIAGLTAGMEAGRLRRQPVRPLAHLLLAALGEAGMVIANAEDPRVARAEVEPALLSLLEGLQEPRA